MNKNFNLSLSEDDEDNVWIWEFEIIQIFDPVIILSFWHALIDEGWSENITKYNNLHRFS